MKSYAWALLGLLAFSCGSQAACRVVDGAICGVGSGRVISQYGDVAISSGASLTEATVGTSVIPGNRILAHEGGASVALGDQCTVNVPRNSVVTFTARKGLTCVERQAALPGDTQEAGVGPGGGVVSGGSGVTAVGGFSPALVGAGIVGIGAVGAAAVAISRSQGGLSP